MGFRFTPNAKSNESLASHSRSSRSSSPASSSASGGMTPEHMLELQAQIGNQQTMAMAEAPGARLPYFEQIQASFGRSDGGVRIHDPAPLQASAYAQGSDIHVASGQEQHLPHEASHVIQQ